MIEVVYDDGRNGHVKADMSLQTKWEATSSFPKRTNKQISEFDHRQSKDAPVNTPLR